MFFPPFFRVHQGELIPRHHDAIRRSAAHPPEASSLSPLKNYDIKPLCPGEGEKVPSKCTKKAAVLDCSHSLIRKGKGSKIAGYEGGNAAHVIPLTAAWGRPVERGLWGRRAGAESVLGKGERVA
jgi:hypothetical protein